MSSSKNIKKIVVTIFVTAVVYFIFGTVLYASSIEINTRYFNTTYLVGQEPEIEYLIENKAPLNIPMFNAYFIVQVKINRGSDTTRAYYTISRSEYYFPDNPIDIGILNAGDEYNYTFKFIDVMEAGNIEFTIEAYMNIFNTFQYKVAEETFIVKYTELSAVLILPEEYMMELGEWFKPPEWYKPP